MSPEEQVPAVIVPDKDPVDFMAIEWADENQVIEDLRGRVLETYVYEVKRWNHKTKRNEIDHELSLAGINAACRALAKKGEVIRILDIQFDSDNQNPEYILVRAQAKRFKILGDGTEVGLDSEWGVKWQWRNMKKKIWENGRIVGEEVVSDPFFFEKATSKASRNAKKKLIPESAIKVMIKLALKEGKVGKVENGDGGKSGGNEKASKKGEKAKATPQTKKASSIETLKQELFAAMKKISGDPATQKAIWQNVSGKNAMNDASESLLKSIKEALQSTGDGKPFELVKDEAQVYTIVDRENGHVLWPNNYKQPETQTQSGQGSSGQSKPDPDKPMF